MRKLLRKSLAIGLVCITVTVLSIALWSQQAIAQSSPDVYYNTFEYADMRANSPGTPSTALLPGEEPNQPSGVYTGGGWNGTGVYSFTNVSNDCKNGSWCVRADRFPADGGHSCCLFWTGSGTRPPNQTTSHLFYRHYQRYSTGYQFVSGKMNYMRDMDTGASTVIVHYFCPPDSHCTTPPNFELSTGLANYACNQGKSCQIATDNQWHSYETELDPGNGSANAATMRMWYDDVLVLEYCPTCAQHATIPLPYSPNAIGFGEYANGGGTEGGGTITQNQTFWLDDLAISRSRIGPVAGTPPSPPPAPSNLVLY